jgi:hypothetical protein
MEDILRDGSQNNAMAECALALAMAFFSIMVLTMVSMGAGFESEPAGKPPAGEQISIRPSTPSDEQTPKHKSVADGSIIIHYQGRFYDAHLAPLAPGAIPSDGRTILAIDPALSMADAIAVRQRIPNPDLTVTTLDGRWLQALKEMPR